MIGARMKAETMSHTHSDTRDVRAIAAVECPRCHAWAGAPCFFKGQPTPVHQGRPFCHSERRKAYQAWRDARGGLIVADPRPGPPQ
jgi:hypothetical protein